MNNQITRRRSNMRATIRKHYTVLSWLAVLVCMGLIFYLSSQSGEDSGRLSAIVTTFIMNIIERITGNSEFDLETFNHVVRKLAHFTAYFILGSLLLNALHASKVRPPKSQRYAYITATLYAATDECHQMFSDGRGPQLRDVAIDSAGALIGVILTSILIREIIRIKNK